MKEKIIGQSKGQRGCLRQSGQVGNSIVNDFFRLMDMEMFLYIFFGKLGNIVDVIRLVYLLLEPVDGTLQPSSFFLIDEVNVMDGQ